MTDWYWVKDKSTGHQYAVAVVDPDAHEVLEDKDATDGGGVPLPGKPNVPMGTKTETAASSKAETSKERSAS